MWVVVATANIFLLLFLSILVALYLGALRDYLVHRLRVPELVAFWLAVLLTAGAVAGLVWLLVPPVVEQTQGLLAQFPDLLTSWEAWVTRTLDKFPGMADLVTKLGAHPLVGPVSDYLSGRLPTLFGDVSKRVLSVFGCCGRAAHRRCHEHLPRALSWRLSRMAHRAGAAGPP